MQKVKGTQEPKAALSAGWLYRLATITLVGYVMAVVLFYFLAGDQLHLRESRGDIALLPADSGTVELTAGNIIEQRFYTDIQRLEQIDIQWGTYYRQNAGSVYVELINDQEDIVLLSQSFDAAAITEGGFTTLKTEKPIEGLYQIPLLLRITSPDGASGSAVSPMMNTQSGLENGLLTLNGTPTQGILCFSARGTDYIWTGLHYWEFAVAGFIIQLIVMLLIAYRFRAGKHSYVINALTAVQKYRFLIRQLVSRDFKTKYKRSVLGVFWSFLNPLLQMIVQYFVFSTVFKNDIENFAVYLLIGVVSFNFFSESCGMALTSIVGNSSLITKVYMPKYIYPLTRVMSSVINLAISLIPLLIVSSITGIQFHRSMILALFFLGCLIIFCLGVGLLLSASMVFFRDTQFLWNVLNMIWMYATPIFYPETILTENFRFVLQINPVYHFLKSTRLCILDGISPEPVVYVHCLLMAFGTLMLGALVFRKTQDRFILYI